MGYGARAKVSRLPEVRVAQRGEVFIRQDNGGGVTKPRVHVRVGPPLFPVDIRPFSGRSIPRGPIRLP